MKVVERGVEIPVEKIKSSPFQPRMNFDLESLLSSISEDGILRPLWVRRIGIEEYELIDGERRLRAAKELGMQTVPCDIIEVDDETARRLVWRLNIQQRTYGDKEKAYYFKRLHEKYKISINRIAKECGVHRHIITAYLNIFRLPEKYQKIIWGEKPGNLTVTHIREMENLFASKTPIQEITEILDYVLENNLSTRELRQFLKSRKETGKEKSGQAPAHLDDPGHARGAGPFQKGLEGRVLVIHPVAQDVDLSGRVRSTDLHARYDDNVVRVFRLQRRGNAARRVVVRDRDDAQACLYRFLHDLCGRQRPV